MLMPLFGRKPLAALAYSDQAFDGWYTRPTRGLVADSDWWLLTFKRLLVTSCS